MKARRLLRLTQVEFAQLLGVHPITVSKWERRTTEPTAYLRALISEFENGDAITVLTTKGILQRHGPLVALANLLRHLAP